jgi:hypothetical protein
LLLLINWDATAKAKVALRSPAAACRAEGFSILGDATVQSVRMDCAGERWTAELAPQEARLLRLVPETPVK